MRQVAQALVAVFGLLSVAAGGNIDGKIVGWPANFSSSQHHGVVWLEGTQKQAASQPVPVMAQRGGQFVPPFLVVVAGQTVSMPNEDDVAHNVYSLSPAKEFNLGYYAKGEVKTVTFDRPGIVEVLCVIHNFMRAQILVVPNPYYSTIAADGSFRIRNIPAGRFTLTFWANGMASFSQEVTVPEGNKAVALSVSVPDSPARKQ
jgi:plastocyanin